MDSGQMLSVKLAEVGRHDCSPVASLSAITRVAKSLHELSPRPSDVFGAPAGTRGPIAEAVARQPGTHDVKGISGVAAVGGRIDEGVDDLQKLDHRSGPTMG